MRSIRNGMALSLGIGMGLVASGGVPRPPGGVAPQAARPGTISTRVPGPFTALHFERLDSGRAGGAWWRELETRCLDLGLGPPAPLFARPGRPRPLDRWYRIPLSDPAGRSPGAAAGPGGPAGRGEGLRRLRSWLAARPGIGIVELVPVFEPAFDPGFEAARSHPAPADGGSCPIRTPNYDHLQGYQRAAPSGIDVLAAWSLPGGRGEGLWFADIEGAWNDRHEDLPADRMEHSAGQPIRDRHWEAHGTAVLGVVAARDNELGMIGIAPGVERILTGSIGLIGAARAIDTVAGTMRPGDVLLIELHGPGPRSGRDTGQKGFVPIEYWSAEFEAIQHHAGRGIVIVEAAGNGGEDLDDPVYEGRFDRRQRDSGAVLVGAGAPAAAGFTDRSRLDFSNHGSRVDLQGWGRRVATLDYGDLQDCSGFDRHYTSAFSGTSSASPVVAGALLCLQGVWRARTGGVLTAGELRDLLAATGSPQTDGPAGPATQHIGPRPDLARALVRLGGGRTGGAVGP